MTTVISSHLALRLRMVVALAQMDMRSAERVRSNVSPGE